MKKPLICLLSILFAVAFCSLAQAMVKGPLCSDCHTMHNSQGGQMVTEFTPFEAGGTVNPSLLITTCLGCHSATAVDVWQDSSTNAPIVYNSGAPTYGADGLAGGNLYWATQSDCKGHNVAGVAAADANFTGKDIPGSTTAYYQLTCAGQYGCHGDRSAGNDEVDAIRYAHHTLESAALDGSSVGQSYRFLNGILGVEDTDWEQDNVNTSHNEYKGATDFDNSGAISSLCGQCHGDYHNSTGVGSASPWLRHPTDIVLPNDGEYQYYNGEYGVSTGQYSMTAPLARPNPTASSSTVSPGTDIVMCLSCHRPHGSPYFKMLRWDILNDFSTGCGVCHTSKK